MNDKDVDDILKLHQAIDSVAERKKEELYGNHENISNLDKDINLFSDETLRLKPNGNFNAEFEERYKNNNLNGTYKYSNVIFSIEDNIFKAIDDNFNDYLELDKNNVYALIELYPFDMIKLFSTEFDLCKYALSQDGNAIKELTDPSTELCKIAVSTNPFSIQYIKNPTEEVCIEALRYNGDVIKFINSPSLTLDDAAITNNPYSLQYMKTTSGNTILKALREDAILWDFSTDRPDLIIKLVEQPSDVMLSIYKATSYDEMDKNTTDDRIYKLHTKSDESFLTVRYP